MEFLQLLEFKTQQSATSLFFLRGSTPISGSVMPGLRRRPVPLY